MASPEFDADSPGYLFRTRVGVAIFVIGLMLVLWAWGSWVYRLSVAPSLSAVGPTAVEELNEGQVQAASGMRFLLVVSLVLTVTVLFGTYALSRWIRRQRDLADRRPAPPTPVDDVWSHYRLTDDIE